MREREAAHAASRAEVSARASSAAQSRLDTFAAQKAGALGAAAAREERAYERRVAPQRGVNEVQHAKVFAPTANNGLVTRSHEMLGSARSTARSFTLGNSSTTARERCFEKRNGSQVHLDHFASS